MRKVEFVVFRYLTYADYFNIYKPAGAEERGGGQTYIDFAIGYVTQANWESFLGGAYVQDSSLGDIGPRWNVRINNIGVNEDQVITIYQRRPQTFSIAAQRIGSTNSNRVLAWHPDHGFPQPVDPSDRQAKPDGLVIYLVKCSDRTIWAGWFQDLLPCIDQATLDLMKSIINSDQREGYSGFMDLSDVEVFIEESDSLRPFRMTQPVQPVVTRRIGQPTATRRIDVQTIESREEQITNELLLEDDQNTDGGDPQKTRWVQAVFDRNQRAVRQLKQLYRGRCQLTGTTYTFEKINGELYSEAHHLIPLGEQGADSPFNIIIVSPLIHRMLHYARVSGLDLSNITQDHTLEITINERPFTISWHPAHAELVRRH
jgi:5-methylcytosine-specific restriction protein A